MLLRSPQNINPIQWRGLVVNFANNHVSRNHEHDPQTDKKDAHVVPAQGGHGADTIHARAVGEELNHLHAVEEAPHRLKPIHTEGLDDRELLYERHKNAACTGPDDTSPMAIFTALIVRHQVDADDSTQSNDEAEN